MTLVELKEYLTNGNIPTEFFILVSKDNKFLARQYIQTIEKLSANGLTQISSIYEPQQTSMSLLTMTEDTVNVLYVDTFDERAEDYGQFINTIVVCDQIDKSIASCVEKYVIKMPKLEEWQICDYAKTLCPAVDEADLIQLIKATNSDIERVINELDKVALFGKNEQKAIFSAVWLDTQKDFYNADLFTVVNALVDGNATVLFDFLKCGNATAIEPVVLANRAFTSLKNIALASQNPGISAEDCGMSAGQFRFIKYNYRNLDIEAVKQKIKFLTKFDLDLKSSRLDITKQDMLSYLICNMMFKITK